MSKTACAVPFTTLDISADGTPLICCSAPVTLTIDGRPALAGRDPFDAIWNAPEIVSVRTAMARGEKPDACRTCWDHEEAGAQSLRLTMNGAMQTVMGADWSLSQFVREAEKTELHLSTRPMLYQLQLGNTCNLKCRSCNPWSSSRIAADPVHRAWSASDYLDGHLPPAIPRSADDRDGRHFLAATRRAVRGPSSGLVLLRRLRDSLGSVDGAPARIFGELEQVVALHERSRDELTALVEASFAKSPHVSGSAGQRWVPVAARHLPSSGGRVSIDQLGAATGAELAAAEPPMSLEGDDVTVLGWAHTGEDDPSVVDLFLVLTSVSSTDERVYRLHDRNGRPDVAASFPGYPEHCGFGGNIPLGELRSGTYRIGIAQRTPTATYYDPTPISVRRD